MKQVIQIILLLLISTSSFAQKDWSNVDFGEEYKSKIKIKGSSAKSLKANPTFIANYTIAQAVDMKASKKSATKSIFQEVTLTGVSSDAYQEAVNSLYSELMKALEDAGIQITDGAELMNSDVVQKKLNKGKKNEYIGNTGEFEAIPRKKGALDDGIMGYDVVSVIRDLSFMPDNKNTYKTNNYITSGLFYTALAKKEEVNLLDITFYVSFVEFKGGRGYKSINLASNAKLGISMRANLYTPNGMINFMEYGDLPVYGGDEWSKGFYETKDNEFDAEYFAVARSSEFEIMADSEKYLNEVSSIIKFWQLDIVNQIKKGL